MWGSKTPKGKKEMIDWPDVLFAVWMSISAVSILAWVVVGFLKIVGLM